MMEKDNSADIERTESTTDSDGDTEKAQGRFSKFMSKVAEMTLGTAQKEAVNKETDLLEQEAAEFSQGVPPEKLKKDTDQMFDKINEYAKLELEGTLSELKCLEQMNRVTATKYSEMLSTAEGLKAFQLGLHKKYQELLPVFAEIDDLENSVTEFERVTDLLDAYSKRLDEKSLIVMKQRHNTLDRLQR